MSFELGVPYCWQSKGLYTYYSEISAFQLYELHVGPALIVFQSVLLVFNQEFFFWVERREMQLIFQIVCN